MLFDTGVTGYPVFQKSALGEFNHAATLFFYDEPIHFLCRTTDGKPWVAMALDDNREQRLTNYLLAPVTEAEFQAHIEEGDLAKMVELTIHAMDREAHQLTYSWDEDQITAEKPMSSDEARAFFPTASQVARRT